MFSLLKQILIHEKKLPFDIYKTIMKYIMISHPLAVMFKTSDYYLIHRMNLRPCQLLNPFIGRLNTLKFFSEEKNDTLKIYI